MKMKNNRGGGMKKSMLVVALVAGLSVIGTLHGAEVAQEDAETAVKGWLTLKESFSNLADAETESVATIQGEDDAGKFHVVALKGGGFVITSGDTEMAPILAWSEEGEFVADSSNPLYDILRRDVAGRAKKLGTGGTGNGGTGSVKTRMLMKATSSLSSSSSSASSANATQWSRLQSAAAAKAAATEETGTSTVAAAKTAKAMLVKSSLSNGKISESNFPTPVVAPLCETRWNQSDANGGHCYNYYTPSNDPAGCVAITFAQLMRAFKYPDYSVVANGTYTGKVSTQQYNADGSKMKDANGNDYVITETWTTEGLDPAFGGIYDWENMPALSSQVTTDAHRQAIGKLVRDCGMAVGMHYANYGSGSSTSKIAGKLTDQFGYTNAVLRMNDISYEEQKDAMLTSFDLGSPVGVGISGHSIVSDGYGYSTGGRLYIHYNYGWGESSTSTAWYTPPEPEETAGDYPGVGSMVYNIFTPYFFNTNSVTVANPSIVCGTLLDSSSNAVANATVTATGDKIAQSYTATTDANGKYYLYLPGDATYTIAAGSGADSVSKTLGVAKCTNLAVGNVRDVDLVLGSGSGGSSGAATLAHRWSFTDGSLADTGGSQSSATAATVCGSNSASCVTFADGKVSLSGASNGAGYLTLGSNIISDTATIEIWASHDRVRNWSRVFDYGTDTTNYVTFCWTQGNDPRTDLFTAKNTRVYASAENTMCPWTAGTQYHISMTFEKNESDGSTFIRWQRRDAATGEVQRQGSRTVKEFALSSLGDAVPFYLGHSQFEADCDANATYDEVRVWSGVLTDAQLDASAAAGPDATISADAQSGAPVFVAAAAAEEEASSIPAILAGHHPPTHRGRISYGSDRSGKNYYDTTWPDVMPGSYSGVGEADIGELDREDSSTDAPAILEKSQIRYDGWVNVSAAQAGWWTINQAMDDYFMFSIDGDWAVFSHTYSGSASSSVRVTEGWHRFTIVCGDTYGGWGASLAHDDKYVPMTISINGGVAMEFTPDNFTFGSDAPVVLDADADWRSYGEIVLDTAVSIDLNGHTLYVDTLTASCIGASVTNSAATTGILHGVIDSSCITVCAGVSADAELVHRWSFDSDFSDSVGGSDAVVMKNDTSTSSVLGGNVTISGGKAVLAGGGSAGYLNFGEGVLGSDYATLEFWATRTAEQNAWMYLATYGIPDISPCNFFTLAVSKGSGDASRWGCTENRINGVDKGTPNLIGMPVGVLYHVSATFMKNSDGSTTIRWMIRDGKTGFLLSEGSITPAGWTLADAADAGWALTLGNNPWDNSNTDLSCEIDEVRVWRGILSDEQLLLNAVAGPDAPGSGVGDAIVLGGTLDMAAPGGYGFATDAQVIVSDGAKIKFDTANYHGPALRFKTGGLVLPVGVSSATELAELTDSDNFTVSTEDGGNTINVALNSDIPLVSVWKGGTPASAADLANASNWASTNSAGAAISAAPGSRTTVIIPADKLATFTIPADVTASLDWGRVLLGGYTITTAGYYGTAPNPRLSAYRDYALSYYTFLSDYTGNDYFNGNGTTFQNSYLAGKQLRFDGWFYVSAAQAGRWKFTCDFDDITSLAIDGKWIFLNPKWEPGCTAGCFVSEGWHRFTLIEADTGVGKGCEITVSGTRVPFSISINGGTAVAFHSAFSFGTAQPSISLSADANWAAMGPVAFENAIAIDLNGHNLTVADGESDYVGAKVVNSDTENESTIYTYSGEIDTSLTSGSAGTVNISSTPAATATWTGASGTGLANDHRNWNCYDSTSTLLPGALPISSTTVTVNNDSVATVNDGMTLAWGATTFGTGPNGGLYQDGGTLTVNGEYHLGYTANKASTNTFNGGTFTATGTLRLGGASGAKGVLNVDGGTVTVPSVAVPQVSGGVGELNIDSGTFKVTSWVDLAQYAGSNIWNQSGGEVSVGGNFWIGRNNSGVGIYNLSGGKLSNTGGSFDIGRFSPGYFNMSGGTLSATVATCVGRDGNGWFHQTDGDFTVNNCFRMGWGSYTGEYTLDGGTLTITSWLGIGAGNNGTGHFVQNGGTFNILNENFSVADNGVGTYTFNDGEINAQRLTIGCWNQTRCNGTFVMNGGTLNVSEGSTYDTSAHWFWIGRHKVGSFTQNGGEINAYSGVMLAKESTATGTLALNGGVLRTRFLKKGSGTANTVTFAGGKIAILDENYDSSAFFDGLTSFAFGAGGLTFDTAGYDVTMSSGTFTSTASGSLFRKEGEGTFTIHTLPPVDDIYVDGGVLALSATVDNTGGADRNLTVAEGATLDLGGNTLTQPILSGGGMVQNGTLVVTGAISPCGATNDVGTLTLAAPTTVTGAIKVHEGDLINSTSTLDLTGASIVFDAEPGADVKAFTFVTSTSPIAGVPRPPRGWKVKVLDDGRTLKLIRAPRNAIIVR